MPMAGTVDMCKQTLKLPKPSITAATGTLLSAATDGFWLAIEKEMAHLKLHFEAAAGNGELICLLRAFAALD